MCGHSRQRRCDLVAWWVAGRAGQQRDGVSVCRVELRLVGLTDERSREQGTRERPDQRWGGRGCCRCAPSRFWHAGGIPTIYQPTACGFSPAAIVAVAHFALHPWTTKVSSPAYTPAVEAGPLRMAGRETRTGREGLTGLRKSELVGSRSTAGPAPDIQDIDSAAKRRKKGRNVLPSRGPAAGGLLRCAA